ncbi:hypothetical protein CHL76_14670 [Marinococcus halophilus]|uniref:AB hydrolase-1 domain-containing protein n=1 Tax=Marinococcus halophilus TaxID=1371 RepID=A0A510Y985_MARHA|nr:alpha/beta hydrolase [Marinococcus halophilus]OZT79060.1 hypothetical protein CHL76_14670 [Marinococcus halophilus]GEK59956.1 hypothetical protein MHA01_28610 [Marinococcus halophilus]
MTTNIALEQETELCISKAGSGNQTVILVHGLTGNHKQMHFYQETLAENFHTISYDLRGRGDSTQASSDTSIFTHADDLISLIKTEKISKPILIGYSMGGYICALVASKLPDVQQLVLLDGAGQVGEEQRQKIIPSLSRLEKEYDSERDYLANTKDIYKNLGIEWDGMVEAASKHEVIPTDNYWKHKSDIRKIQQDFESFFKFSAEEVFPQIKCETLLVIAEGAMGTNSSLFNEDSYTSLQRLLKPAQIQHSEANHYELVFNRQEDILQVIQSFLMKGGKA